MIELDAQNPRDDGNHPGARQPSQEDDHMPYGTCTIEGCAKTGQLVREMCSMHYTRWLRDGDPGESQPREIHATRCAVDGCKKPGPYHRGMCEMHYTRVKRTGGTERRYYQHTPGERCSAQGCNRLAEIREYCPPHAQRAKAGVPLDGPLTPRETPEAKLQRLTEWRDGCLVWTGPTGRDGYGILATGNKRYQVHRWAYQQAHGQVPANLDIDHICQNPACCNIKHLRTATKKQNAENRNRPNRNNKSSGILGVGYDKVNNAWTAQVMHYGKKHWGGRWGTKEQAEEAVKALRVKLYTYYAPEQPDTLDTAMSREQQ